MSNSINEIKVGGKVDPKKGAKIQNICNKMRRIIGGQPSDVIFEALAIVCATNIKEYMEMAIADNVSITEIEVYNLFIDHIKNRLESLVFIPDQTN
jgi:hypothetical protein